ncbi:MAG TPA: protein kinase [Anaerolineales bacterium]|nr:protein kinase [Anaerolineales bacterium]
MTLSKETLLRNRYRVLEILGEGGMGSVYKARDENLGVDVAVKENLFTTVEYSRQFQIEAQILATLRHPNLTRVTDHFEQDQIQYIVMDYIDGEDLRDRMERVGILSEDEVIKIGVSLCDALNYLHNLEPTILHRDIKPGNVRISPNGQVFLVDFGLAKIVRGNQMTVTGARAMTPGYSPPEQYGTARTDERSDIYSLGASLYSALTSELPEDGLARAMNQSELTPIRVRNPAASRKLANVIEKALAVQPDERFQDAIAFRKALVNCRGITRRRPTSDELMVPPPPDDEEPAPAPVPEPEVADEAPAVWVSEPVAVSETGPQPAAGNGGELDAARPGAALQPLPIKKRGGSRPRRPEAVRRRARSRWNQIGVFFVFLLVGGGIGAILAFPGISAQALAFFQPPPANPTATVPPADTSTPAPTATPPAPTATHAVVVVEPGSPTPSATVTATAVPPTMTPAPGPTPRGGAARIAFASDRSGSTQIWLMDGDGSNPVQLTDIDGGACQPDWSPDGTRLIFISPCSVEQEEYPGAALYIVNLDGTGLTPVIGSRNGDYDPDWSADGSQILFTTLRNGFPEIHILNLNGGLVTPLADEGIKNFHPAWNADGSRISFITARPGPFQIWTMNPDGSEQVRFSRSGDLRNSSPAWSPDGRFIVFTQRATSSGLPYLILAPIEDGGFSEIRLALSTSPARGPAYSPDGSWIVFEAWPDGNHDIYLLDMTTLTVIRLTSDDSYEFDPDWQP